MPLASEVTGCCSLGAVALVAYRYCVLAVRRRFLGGGGSSFFVSAGTRNGLCALNGRGGRRAVIRKGSCLPILHC